MNEKTRIEDDYEVLMSPLLSSKFEKMDKKLKNIETYLNNNREIYMGMMEKIQQLSIDNKEILKENREMYTNALSKIEETERNNMNELKPLIENIEKNNIRLEENMLKTPYYHSRMYNHFWRKNAVTSKNTMISGLVGLPFLDLEINQLINKNE